MVIHGYNLTRETNIPEIGSLARIFHHVKTGAEILSLSNDDENKVFGITFRTPPTDSTGIAHILEHSVLCGSRKFPVKEPFVELLKGSLNTFLNAFTFPDKTCYPVASQNVRDFHNLLNVYLDAVFFPRLSPHIFQQEGWHYEMSDPSMPLTMKGVVLNEMKGAYSSPDSLLSEFSMQSLFPDSTYGNDSGGNPEIIPKLTYDQFIAFHRDYYHPSNARIFFYGDDDLAQCLRLVDEYLDEFDKARVDSAIAVQKPFEHPVRSVQPFPAPESETIRKGMVTVNWGLPVMSEAMDNFGLRVLEHVLLGIPASPLRRALVDSGLGEDLAGDGLCTEIRQPYFSTGLKGVDIADADRIEHLILDALDSLVSGGIHPHSVDAAFNTLQFRLRENDSGRLPRGLALMLRSLTTWLYEGDPLALLAFEQPLNDLESKLKAEKGYLESFIEEHLVRNTHRSTLILEPDPGLQAMNDARENARLENLRSSMTRYEIDHILKTSRELRLLQEKPDSPEDLATIPTLDLHDLDRRNKTLPLETEKAPKPEILFHDIETNGIFYLDIGFDLQLLPDEYLSLVPLFGRALLEMGTRRKDFAQMTLLISRKTGGITHEVFTSSVKGPSGDVARLFLRARATLDHVGSLLDILQEILFTARLDDHERFKQILLEEKAGAEEKLFPSGHQLVNLRLRSHFSKAHWAAEQVGGISYLFYLRDMVGKIETDWEGIHAMLMEMQRTLVNKSMLINATLDKKSYPKLRSRLRDFQNALPDCPGAPKTWSWKSDSFSEGLIIPSQVNYVGKGAVLYDSDHSFHGSALVITRYLRNSWLWDRIRVQGGAYGAFCVLDYISGVLSFLSYRDPNTLETLDSFDRAAEFLKNNPVDSDELKKSIIGAIGDLDSHMTPRAKGFVSMGRHLKGETEEDRQKIREQILHTCPSDFRNFAQILEKVRDNGLVKILGPERSVERAAEGGTLVLKRLKVL